MSAQNYAPDAVDAPLPARQPSSRLLEDLDVEVSPSVTPQRERLPQAGLIRDLKLLFAALGAGNSVVPLGDNSRTTRLLSEYARSLRAL